MAPQTTQAKWNSFDTPLSDWQQTVAQLQGSDGKHPEDPFELMTLGQAYLKGRLVGPAEECFRAALCRVPELSSAHYHLGCLYSRQGLHQEAAIEFRKCLAAQPRNGYVYAELGLVYFKQGQVQEARALWQQGLLLTNEEEPLVELLRHMSFSVTLDGEERVVPNLCRMATLAADRDHELACSYLERARQLEPFNPVVFATYAHVFAAAEKRAETEAAWQEAIRLAPSNPTWQAGLAEFLLTSDKPKEAHLWAERAVALAPREAQYHLLLARTEEKSGNLEAAELHLKVAQELEPANVGINYALGQLLWQERKFPVALCYLRRAARAGHKEAGSYLTRARQLTKARTMPAFPASRGGTSIETAY